MSLKFSLGMISKEKKGGKGIARRPLIVLRELCWLLWWLRCSGLELLLPGPFLALKIRLWGLKLPQPDIGFQGIGFQGQDACFKG